MPVPPAITPSSTGVSSQASSVSTERIFSKGMESGATKRGLIPSFAAFLTGHAEVQTEQGEKVQEDSTGDRETQMGESLTGAAAAMRELLGHHVVEEQRTPVVISSAHPVAIEKKAKETREVGSRLVGASSSQEVKRQEVKGKETTQPMVSIIPVHAQVPATHLSGRWNPGSFSSGPLQPSGSRAESSTVITSPGRASSATAADVSGKSYAPAMKNGTPSQDFPSVTTSASVVHPLPHADASAESIRQVERHDVNADPMISTADSQSLVSSMSKVQSKLKVEEKPSVGSTKLSPASSSSDIGVNPSRAVSDPVSIPHAETSVNAGAKRQQAPLEVNNAFQRLDAGEAPPALLHSSAHSIAVGVHDPALGWLEVQTQNSAGHLSATLTTASAEAHENLTADAPAITQYLADRNIAVHSLHVGGQGSSAGSGESQSGSGDPRQQTSAQKENASPEPERSVRPIDVAHPEVSAAYGSSRISVRA